MPDDQSRALLIGALAVHLRFVTEEQLSSSLVDWTADASRPLEAVLQERGLIDSDATILLASMADKQIAFHESSLEQAFRTQFDASRTSMDPWSTNFSAASVAQPAAVPLDLARHSARYHKLKDHAKGGLGQVYLALDEELNRKVALKQIQERFSSDSGARQRFLLEAEVTGGLEHPGIVPVYGLGIYKDGQPYYAMRFIHGESLEQAVRHFHKSHPLGGDSFRDSNRTLELRKLLGRLINVCQAIAYAHSRGVLHRDIKPDNIMLGQYGETLVVDWGLAKVSGKEDIAALPNNEQALTPTVGTDSNPTRIGSVIGTPAFMSPEQAEGRVEAIDERSDVYSLGATLYYILVGRPPFQGRDSEGKPISIARLLERVRTGEFESPRQVDLSLPKPLAAICSRAMATNANKRYASPLELAEELERWLADEPVVAYRETPIERIKRWAKRHQTLTATAASVVLVSVIGLSLFAAVLGNKNIALTKAEAEAREKAAIANAVTQFLNDDLLAQASPSEHPDPALQVRTVFKQATKSLQNRFDDQPLVKAKLLHTIGVASGYLAHLKESEAALVEASQLCAEHLGPDHPETLRSQAALGKAYAIGGKYKQAEAMLRKTLQRQREILGANHEEVFATGSELANVLGIFGRFDEANRLIDEAMEGYTKSKGPADSATVDCLNTKVVLMSDQGNPQKALELALDLRERCIDAPGEDIRLAAIEAEMTIAQQLLVLERYEEAKTTYQTALSRLIESLGETHPYVAAIRNDLAILQTDQDDPNQALATLRELATLAETRFGPNHRDTIIAKLNAGRALIFLRRYDEAKVLFESSLTAAVDHLGSDSPVANQTRIFLALLESESENIDAAEGLLKEVVGPASQSALVLPTSELEAKSSLAKIYISQERYDKAESLLQIARKQYRNAGLDRTYGGIEVISLLIDTMVESDRADQASELVQEIASQYGTDDAITNQSRLRFAENLFDRELDEHAQQNLQQVTQSLTAKPLWERKDFEPAYYLSTLLSQQDLDADAIPIFERLLSAQTESLGVDHVDRLSTMHDLAISLSYLERHEEAAKLYEEVVQRRSKVYGPNAEQTLQSLYNLSEDQVSLGDDQGAIGSLTRLLEARRSQGVEAADLIDENYSLAESLRKTKDYASAVPYYRATLEGETATLGEDNADTLLTMHQLAYCLDEAGHDNEAMEVYRRVVDGRTRTLGESHPHTLLSLGNLTRLRSESLDTAAAETAIDDMRRRLEKLPNEDADTINANYVIAEAYRTLKRHEDALEFYRKAMEGRRRLLGNDHEESLLSAHQVAYTCSLIGKMDEAVELYEEVVKGRTKTFGPAHEYTLLSLTNAALIQIDRGQYEQAAALLQDKLDRITKEKGVRHPETMAPRIELGSAKYLARDYLTAIDLLSQSVDVMRKTLPRDPPPAMQQTLCVVLALLADAEIHDGQILAAERHVREAIETLEALTIESVYLYRAKSVLGEVLTSRRDFEKAEEHLLLAYEKQGESSEEVKPRVLRVWRKDTLRRLLELYEKSHNREKLTQWQKIQSTEE